MLFRKNWLIVVLIILSMLTTGGLQAQTDSQWEENLDALITELPQRHVDPFTQISEEEFLAAAETLRADLPTLNNQQILIRMVALVALLGDSHTTLNWTMDAPLFPLGLLVFEDGLYVVAALPDTAEALATRLISVNGHPIEEVIAQVRMIIPHENEAWLNGSLPNYVIRSEVLIGLGIIESVEPVVWEFETPMGETLSLEIAPIAPADLDISALIPARSLESFPRTENTSGNYWLNLFDDGTLYFKYNTATEAPDLPMSQFTEILLTALAEQPVERLVIDLRSNSGGNSTLLDPLITALQDQPINVSGKLFVIIGSRTFSSALLNAFRLGQETEAVLVGQPTGGSPNHFGEVQRFDLPHFDLSVTYSTNYFEMMPGEAGATLVPDVLVPLTIADYVAGIDPFYAAVLAYAP